MNAMDKRKVIIIDIPGTFLQRDWPQDKHPGYIMFEKIMVDTIYEFNPSFCDMIIWSKEGKEKFLYSRLIKEISGALLGVIIFFNKLSKHLTEHEFAQDKYDICTFKKW